MAVASASIEERHARLQRCLGNLRAAWRLHAAGEFAPALAHAAAALEDARHAEAAMRGPVAAGPRHIGGALDAALAGLRRRAAPQLSPEQEIEHAHRFVVRVLRRAAPHLAHELSRLGPRATAPTGRRG